MDNNKILGADGNKISQEGVLDADLTAKITPEMQALIDAEVSKKALDASSRDKQIGKMSNKMQEILAENEALKLSKQKEEAERIKNLSEVEQAKVYKDQAETLKERVQLFEKKDKFISLCSEHNLDYKAYMGTAMNMDINDLSSFTISIKDAILSAKTMAEQTAKTELQNKISSSQPGNGLTTKTKDQELNEMLKAKGLI